MSLSVIRFLKRTTAAVCAAVTIGIGGVSLAGPATADIGDGYLGCHTGEICFYYWQTSYKAEWQNPTRQFWYSDWYHGNDYFNNRGLSRVHFWDNVRARRNRDTRCGVYLKDYSQSPYYMSNNGYYLSLPYYYWDVNNYHYRYC